MPKVSVTIITLNEADHIAQAIDSAAWADEVIVVDAGSTDGTQDLARGKGVTVATRAWSGYVDQKNYAAGLARHDWISRSTPTSASRRRWHRKSGRSSRPSRRRGDIAARA